ncbi:MAG TPA: dual specificity protein phosphatase [Ktedonobacterales bacterium]
MERRESVERGGAIGTWRGPEGPDPIERAGATGRGWVRRYGGHPVCIRVGERDEDRRLFVGGRERTSRRLWPGGARPAVDLIVNLSEHPDRHDIWRPADLWWPRGQGPSGYTSASLLADALVLAGLLRAGRRVLVHCDYGVNRAPTLCAATLMVTEGLTARQALARVRRRRWMALPDPWHWRALRSIEGSARASRAEGGAGDARSA